MIREQLLDHPYMVYRGHRDIKWPLRTTIDRLFFDQRSRHEKAGAHLLRRDEESGSVSSTVHAIVIVRDRVA